MTVETESKVLAFIRDFEPVSSATIALAFRASAHGVYHSTKLLEENGCITRAQVGGCSVWVITDKGRKELSCKH